MLALLSSALVLNGTEELNVPVKFPTATEWKDSFSTATKAVIEKGSELMESVKVNAGTLKDKLNANASELIKPANVAEVTLNSTETTKAVAASRFSKVLAKLKSVKNINIKEPVKNGFNYVVKLPVNGSKAVLAWSKNNPKKAIALTVALVGLSAYAGYALLQQSQAAQEADNN